jgi:probable rRNA maturation factor
MPLYIRNESPRFKIDSRMLKRQFNIVLQHLSIEDKELSVLLVNDHKIKNLNQSFRDKDTPTDVLSFPQFDEEEEGFDSILLGDVVVSLETAERQAEEHGLTFEEEVVLLIVHGLLHLLGYDHEVSAKEEKRMQKKTLELFCLIFPHSESTGENNF